MERPETDNSHEKAKFYPYRWAFLNNAVLKEALVSRGLSTAGSRKAWCMRLSEYEEEVKKVQGQSPSHEGPAIPPRLLKVHMKAGFYLASFMKQVIIRPFKRQLLKVPGVTAWLDESSTYVLKKTKSGNSAAYLKFDTIDKGDAAYFDLKEKLQNHGVEVSHPPFPPMRHAELKNIEDPMETFMTEDFIKEEFVRRLIVLENLPAELNVDEKLCEIFSTALSTVSFEHEPSSQGIAILEMPSLEEVNRLMGDELTVEVTIEDQKIYASKYTQRVNQWTTAVRLNKTEFKKLDMSGDHMDVDSDSENMDTGTTSGKKDFSVVLSDNERLEMSRELSLIKEQMQSTANETDIFGLEKIQRHTALIEKMQDIYKPMVMDAKRRLEYNLPIPEPWHLVPQPIQAIINKGGSSHCLRLEDLEEKFLKSKKEMEEATSEAKKIASSILCVEKQLKGEEASKWEARRPQLELEKVLGTRHPQVGKKGALQATQPVTEEKQYSVYDYGMSLSGVLSQLQDSATAEPTTNQHNNTPQDGPVRAEYAEPSPEHMPKAGGKMRKRDNKGKQKQSQGLAKGYGNQGNKSKVIDDYGQFGRRHTEIQAPQQQGSLYDRKGGSFKDNRGKGQGRPGVGRNMWNRNSREENVEEMDGNDWGSFIGKMPGVSQQDKGRRNTDKKPESKMSGKDKGGNQWPKAGLQPLGREKTGGNNKKKAGGHQQQETAASNDWAQMVGQLFGEVTGGGSGTVVTAEVPVKKRKEDGQEVEKS